MAKLDWLNNNSYAEQIRAREKGWCAWLCWGIALVLLLIPVRGSATTLYYINAAEESPSITGQVLILEPTGRRKNISGGKGGRYHAKVDIEYKGQNYYVTTVGFNFTKAMYRQALETGRVPVYLNPEKPEKSVLSKGVPFLQYFACGLFAGIALLLIAIGCYLKKKKE